ncbi:MAG TPA: LamG-like jellyroll fold domain-containing protein, partial [Gemmatimonadales bacterium]|nr:LamG-like jellyroll fold domain-containing protein [Gemmatimonadales bacterium]
TVNGGKVQSPSGYDVGFYTSSNCSSGKMKWETEQYNGQTGEVAYWVLVPTVYHTKNTVFYLCYGNAAITSNQSQPSAVWDSNFLTVWHLADKGGLDLSNSADTKFALTNSGPVTSASGKIGGGTNKFVDRTYFLDNASISIGANRPVTISMWKKLLRADEFIPCDVPPCPGPDGNHITFTMGATHADNSSMTLWAPFFGTAFWYYGDGGPWVDFSGYYDRWVYITALYNPAASKLEALYLDGSLAASSTNGSILTVTAKGFRLGQAHDGHGQDPSQFDEVRISKSARSSDWIRTEFNNQNDPASFYALGVEIVK